MKRERTKGAHTPANQARICSEDISISCERAMEAREAVPLSACTAEDAYCLLAKTIAPSVFGARLVGGLERWVGYDHAERVGCVPSDDEIQEP
jgi:hypothetical protein